MNHLAKCVVHITVTGVPLPSESNDLEGVWQWRLQKIFWSTPSISAVDMLAIQEALWSNDCLDFNQALQLDDDSKCLQCLPRELRTQLRIAISTAQPDGKDSINVSIVHYLFRNTSDERLQRYCTSSSYAVVLVAVASNLKDLF
jgi:hypothetical protein